MTHLVIDGIFSLENKREDLRNRIDDVYEQMHAMEGTAECSVEIRFEETKAEKSRTPESGRGTTREEH